MTAPENKTNDALAEWIIDHAPYGMILLDGSGNIERINLPASRIFGSENAAELCGRPVSEIAGAEPILQMSGAEGCVRVSVCGRHVELSVVLHNESGKRLCWLRDVTAETAALQKASEAADRVIAQQMRTAQEIALLIGDAAAGTKIALTELKEALNHE